MSDSLRDAAALMKRCAALTGAIATGKSTVAAILAELGAHIVDTDLIARQVVEPGEPALDEIAASFGRGVFDAEGRLDREAMRALIVSDPEKKNMLNRITHPRIGERTVAEVKGHLARDDGMPVIVDVPLLFEVGWDGLFDTILLVYVPREVQIRRLMERDDFDRAAAERNVDAQIDIEEKRQRDGCIVIDNSGSLTDTKRQTEEAFRQIRNRPQLS